MTSDDEARRPIANSLGMTLVPVAPGDFFMGAADDDDLAEAHEKPRHPARIGRAFYLGATEVTVGQFRAFVNESGFKTAAEADGQGASGYDAARRGFEYGSNKYSWRDPGYPQGDDHPVVNVNWHDARAFCDWLGAKEGRRYRLPTEAEWEYACRAGTTPRFVAGDAIENLKPLANLADQSLGAAWDTATVRKYGFDPAIIRFQPWDDGHPFTAPVGRFRPNAWGLYDMLGNVGEFCDDRYRADSYRGAPDPGPPEQDGAHVVRGGTFLNGPSLVRTTSRVECHHLYCNYVIGFRVALEVEGVQSAK